MCIHCIHLHIKKILEPKDIYILHITTGNYIAPSISSSFRFFLTAPALWVSPNIHTFSSLCSHYFSPEDHRSQPLGLAILDLEGKVNPNVFVFSFALSLLHLLLTIYTYHPYIHIHIQHAYIHISAQGMNTRRRWRYKHKPTTFIRALYLLWYISDEECYDEIARKKLLRTSIYTNIHIPLHIFTHTDSSIPDGVLNNFVSLIYWRI